MLEESVNKTDPPCLEGQRKAPKRLDDGSTGHHFSNPKAFYRQQYFEALVLELKMLADLIESSEMNASFPLKEITKLETLCTIIAENASNRKLFSEIDKLLRLYLTVPATSATDERTFSVF